MILPSIVRSLVDASVDATAVVGRDLELLYTNAAYLRLSGLRLRDLANRDTRGMCHRHFGLESCADGCVARRALDTGRSCRVDEVAATRLPLRLIVVAVPLADEGGALWGAMEQYRDVTAESRMQVGYRRLLEQERAQKALLESEVQRQTVELAEANAGLRKALEQVLRLANTDGLTGLLNRRCFDDKFAERLTSTMARQSPLALLLFDLDYFKRVNDVHGHSVGDQVLQEFARVLLRSATQDALVARVGGEEFVMLLDSVSEAGARIVAVRVQELAREAHLLTTTSCGIALYPMDGTSRTDLLRAADRALYAAKVAGRNCVVTTSDVEESPITSVTPVVSSRRMPVSSHRRAPFEDAPRTIVQR